MRNLMLICALLTAFLGQSQDHSDAKFLKTMDYMEFADRIDCDSTMGDNFSHRVCLNKEFQELDSIMNEHYVTLLASIEVDSTRSILIDYQAAWVLHRKGMSRIRSDGFRGHMLGITYLDCMVTLTQGRIEELDYLLYLRE